MNNEKKGPYKKLYMQWHIHEEKGFQMLFTSGERRFDTDIEYVRRAEVEEAVNAAIRRPLGVVPAVAEEFYNAG